MKRIFTSFLALFLASSAAFAQKQSVNSSDGFELKAQNVKIPVVTQAAGERYFGYADADVADIAYVGTGRPIVIAEAIKISAMGGNQLKKIRFNSGQEVDGTIFVLSASTNQLKYVEKLAVKKGWNDVALSTPFTMANNEEYYIGYQVNAAADPRPLAFDNKVDQTAPGANVIIFSNGLFDMATPLVGRDALLDLDAAGLNFGNAMIFLEIDDKVSALDNVAYVTKLSLISSGDLAPNTEAKIKATVRNVGFKPLTSLTFTTKRSAKSPEVEQKIGGLNIAKASTAEVELKINTVARGIALASAKLVKANGKPSWFSNQPLLPYRVVTPNGEAKRTTMLIERFTTEKCPNCPRVDQPLAEMTQQLQGFGIDVSFIAHHSGYHTDFLTVNESIELLPYAFNKQNRTYAPAFMFNRFPSLDPTKDNGAELASLETMEERANAALASPEPVQFSRYAKVEKGGNKVALEVEGVTGYVDLDNLYLTAVITEDGITAKSQAGAPAGYIHDGAARVFMTPALGKMITPNADGSFKITTDAVEIDSEWKTEKMKIVFFVHKNMASPLINQRQVYSSKTMAFNNSGSAEQLLGAQAPRIYAHDGYLVVDADVSELAIYDLAGRLVGKSADRKLAKGVYVVKVTNTYGTFTQKVIVD